MTLPYDTHFYDGKLEVNYIRDMIQMNNMLISENDKCFLIATLLEKSKGQISQLASHYLTMIVGDIAGSYDPSNRINVRDLLIICATHIDNIDFCALLSIQLEELQGGPCVQGRVCRLISALQPFM